MMTLKSMPVLIQAQLLKIRYVIYGIASKSIEEKLNDFLSAYTSITHGLLFETTLSVSDLQDIFNSSLLDVKNDTDTQNLFRRFRRNLHGRAEFKKYATQIIVFIPRTVSIQYIKIPIDFAATLRAPMWIIKNLVTT